MRETAPLLKRETPNFNSEAEGTPMQFLSRSPQQAQLNQSPQVQQYSALQQAINQSAQVQQHRGLQAGVNQSPQVQQANAMQQAVSQSPQAQQAMTNSGTGTTQVTQLQDDDEETGDDKMQEENVLNTNEPMDLEKQEGEGSKRPKRSNAGGKLKEHIDQKKIEDSKKHGSGTLGLKKKNILDLHRVANDFNLAETDIGEKMNTLYGDRVLNAQLNEFSSIVNKEQKGEAKPTYEQHVLNKAVLTRSNSGKIKFLAVKTRGDMLIGGIDTDVKTNPDAHREEDQYNMLPSNYESLIKNAKTIDHRQAAIYLADRHGITLDTDMGEEVDYEELGKDRTAYSALVSIGEIFFAERAREYDKVRKYLGKAHISRFIKQLYFNGWEDAEIAYRKKGQFMASGGKVAFKKTLRGDDLSELRGDNLSAPGFDNIPIKKLISKPKYKKNGYNQGRQCPISSKKKDRQQAAKKLNKYNRKKMKSNPPSTRFLPV